jgi:4-hydroxybenzoyl-CoA thioesterase
MTPSPSTFNKSFRIQFSHCDPAGIVFFPQYMVMLNNHVEDWVCEGLGIRYSDMIGVRRIGMPTVSLNCEFTAISHHGDEVTFELAVGKLGRSSLGLEVRCLGADGQRVKIQQVLVFTSLETHKPIAIPDDFRAGMQRYLRRV